MTPTSTNYSLFDDEPHVPRTETLFPGAVLLHRYALSKEAPLLAELEKIKEASPLRQMLTPGGRTIGVHNTSCGQYGWISDARGYRYTDLDPIKEQAWPAMPEEFQRLATAAAALSGYNDFEADSCLINRYLPGIKMSLHQDKDETDFSQPIVSVSLGMSATFVFGGLQRSDKLSRIDLQHGDVLVWGGPARLLFHGIQTIKDQPHPVIGAQRINLTFRRAK
ncbi:DNA oxidative demethylase AlkB [Undibacterium sp. RuRC25W]|uniref:DNA oxidative demethylase AlkB n=1 Tax=Undibacterium sp. RuRC25W TaxID=3413047 RepID=UPI003BF3AE0B